MTDFSPTLQPCSGCAFWEHAGVDQGMCRCHAPRPGTEVDEVAHWPETLAEDGCGAGIHHEPENARVIRCADCAYWHQPHRGKGLFPMNRKDEVTSWWAQAGHCRRHAPCPSSQPGQRGYWRATHESDGCAEGKRVRTAGPRQED